MVNLPTQFDVSTFSRSRYGDMKCVKMHKMGVVLVEYRLVTDRHRHRHTGSVTCKRLTPSGVRLVEARRSLALIGYSIILRLPYRRR